jgi:hypothetical protein
METWRLPYQDLKKIEPYVYVEKLPYLKFGFR